METIIYLLIFQGLLGGYDVLWNHEWKENLPNKPSAALEQKIHGIRELFYAVVFLGLAWFNWHGLWAWLLFCIIVIEILLTAWDFVIEDKTRLLSPSERITHLVLSMSGGAYVALLIPILWNWSQQPTMLQTSSYGAYSWLLSILGTGVFIWGIRDLASGCLLSHKHKSLAATNCI